MRALSTDEIMKSRGEIIMEKTHDDYVKSNVATFKVANDYMNAPGRWNGPRGVTDRDLTVDEAKALVAERERVGHVLSFAERKMLLNRLRRIK